MDGAVNLLRRTDLTELVQGRLLGAACDATQLEFLRVTLWATLGGSASAAQNRQLHDIKCAG